MQHRKYHITIPGRPVPKGRPRLGKNGNVYTPKKTREYEAFVAWKTKEVVKEPLSGDIAIDIKIYINGNNYPDIDNVCKALLDGMNGNAYEDDRQVAALKICRFKDKNQRVEIELWRKDKEIDTDE